MNEGEDKENKNKKMNEGDEKKEGDEEIVTVTDENAVEAEKPTTTEKKVGAKNSTMILFACLRFTVCSHSLMNCVHPLIFPTPSTQSFHDSLSLLSAFTHFLIHSFFTCMRSLATMVFNRILHAFSHSSEPVHTLFA